MQRYVLTEYADASAEARAVYDDFMRTTGATSVPLWLRSLGHSGALARAYWERAKGTLFGGSLPLPLRRSASNARPRRWSTEHRSPRARSTRREFR